MWVYVESLTENCRCSFRNWRCNGFHLFQFGIHALLPQHRNALFRFILFNHLALRLEGISSSQHSRRTHRLLRQISIGDRHRSTLIKTPSFGDWVSVRAAFKVSNILVLRRFVFHFRFEYFSSFCGARCLRFVSRIARISILLYRTGITFAIFRVLDTLIRRISRRLVRFCII